MLVLFTDFSLRGPYVGLLKVAIASQAPALPIVDLFHDVPPFDAQAASYLLAAYAPELPEGTVVVGVVDPGVGGSRAGLILETERYTFVGPDNGLFDQVGVRADRVSLWRITWRPRHLSASFHGRDLFAPVAVMIATGSMSSEQLGTPMSFQPQSWPQDLARIVYVDRYGNAITGLRRASLDSEANIHVRGRSFHRARTFCDVPVGQEFWYENSSGLVELAVNQGSAAERFGLTPGDPVQVDGKVFSVVRES
jgi:S-adenosylmethionine hydrolase